MLKLVAILAVLGISAGTASADDVAEVKKLYDEGVTDFNLGHFQSALTFFEKAYRAKHDPAFLYNIGQCQRQTRKYEDAARSYRAFLRESPDAPRNVREQVQRFIVEMEQAVVEERTHRAAPQNLESRPDQQGITVKYDPARSRKIMRYTGTGLGAAGLVLVGLGGAFAGLSKNAGDTAYHSAVYDPAADDRQAAYRAADIACFAIGGAAVLAGVTLFTLGVRR